MLYVLGSGQSRVSGVQVRRHTAKLVAGESWTVVSVLTHKPSPHLQVQGEEEGLCALQPTSTEYKSFIMLY